MGIDNIYNTARKMKTNHYIKEEDKKPKNFDNFIDRKEWAIKQFLRSTSDSKAAATIGKVLAQRCLECGLLEVHSDYELDEASPKVS